MTTRIDSVVQHRFDHADVGAMDPPEHPTVTLVIPTFREEASIDATLRAIEAQDYHSVVEILVIDGRSDDRTRDRAATHAGVTVVDNPDRIQAAALNLGIQQAEGDVIVRVDGHCIIATDYVTRCVETLNRTGAAMVGGGMTPVADSTGQKGIAAAMASRFGAGPARFHTGGRAGPVDTVYLGAYRTDLARRVGGYATDVGVNEDAEFAHRMGEHGEIWYEPSIRSTYTPRGSIRAVGHQFYRYGRSRALTVLRHPASLRWRQLVAPALAIGLLSPWRRRIASLYSAGVIAVSIQERQLDGPGRATFAVALPTMHLTWGVGFLIGLADGARRHLGRRRTNRGS